jgi:hypothetical protein
MAVILSYTWALFWAGPGQEKARLNFLLPRPSPARPGCRAVFSYPGPAHRAKISSGRRAGPSVNSYFSQPKPSPVLLSGHKILPRPSPRTCFGPTGRAIFGLGHRAGLPMPRYILSVMCLFQNTVNCGITLMLVSLIFLLLVFSWTSEVPWHLCFAPQIKASGIPLFHILLWALQSCSFLCFMLLVISALALFHSLHNYEITLVAYFLLWIV